MVGAASSETPPSEAARLDAVRRYDVLDAPPDGAFDQVCELAAASCDVPIATVTVVDEDRIFFAACRGLAATEVPREDGLCGSVVMRDDEVYVVADASTDPRTLNNSLVRGELGLRFYAAAPIITPDGHRLGTVNVIDRRPRQLSASQARILRSLAAVVADTLELRLQTINVVRRERRATERAEAERRRYEQLAGALQRSLSPPALPDVPWLELAATYHPASWDNVGGDFYDVFPLHDGSYGMFVGDVCGKGARAAALTSLTRYTLRGAAIAEADPADVLAQLNAAVLLEQEARGDGAPPDIGDEDLLCTVVYGRLSPPRRAGQSARLDIACAGHPAPLIIHPGRAVEPVNCRGPLVGLLPDLAYTATQVQLRPSDTLLLYTDGVTDTSTPHGPLGDDGLVSFLTAGDTTPAGLLARLDTLLAGLQPGRRDDIAAIALSVRAAGEEDWTRPVVSRIVPAHEPGPPAEPFLAES